MKDRVQGETLKSLMCCWNGDIFLYLSIFLRVECNSAGFTKEIYPLFSTKPLDLFFLKRVNE